MGLGISKDFKSIDFNNFAGTSEGINFFKSEIEENYGDLKADDAEKYRFLSRYSTTGEPGGILFKDTGKFYNHSSSDPIGVGLFNLLKFIAVTRFRDDYKQAAKYIYNKINKSSYNPDRMDYTTPPTYTTNDEPPEITPEQINNLIFSENTEIKQYDPALSIIQGGKVFNVLNYGDVASIIASQKAGKSYLAYYMAIMAASPPSMKKQSMLSIDDMSEGHVIYIDAEQAPRSINIKFNANYNYIHDIHSAEFLEQRNHVPDNLKIIQARSLSQAHIDYLLSDYLEYLHSIRPIKMIILDPVTALMKDAILNNEEATAMIKRLMAIAEHYNCLVVTILHKNHNDLKGTGRGHIGSELVRSASAELNISRKKGESTITLEPNYLRDSADFDPIKFEWSDDFSCFVESENQEAAHTRKLKYIAVQIHDSLSDKSVGLRYNDYCNLIADFADCAKSTSKNYLKQMMKESIVEKDEITSVYSINPKVYNDWSK